MYFINLLYFIYLSIYIFSSFYLFTFVLNKSILINTLTILQERSLIAMKRFPQKFLFITIINIILYDIALFFHQTHFNQSVLLYYIITIDVFILCILFPFLRHYQIQTYRLSVKEKKPLRLLYQAKLPDAKLLSEDDLYDIINLKTSIPEHTCSKADYIRYLKRKGLLIVNGQYIWLYGTDNNLYQDNR